MIKKLNCKEFLPRTQYGEINSRINFLYNVNSYEIVAQS